ncbi:hypothetical protein DV711_04935 [Motiliproteus coralliicola]|uniref:Uncharacterized protein n=1 Tax=Motiliproteus coralliicola TaxID=2283196 RepID=A0A369WV35_9GAMM|nr:hypothetical protein [Motiliproteus coralliicola]RDE24929.1 hypothetical protein DV711_04935 [Motiliproteus coralliicola]
MQRNLLHSSVIRSILFSLLLVLPLDTAVASEQADLKQCQRYRDLQQQYTEKRRRGGSKTQMRRWQQQRNHYSRLYSRHNCRVHRRYLK